MLFLLLLLQNTVEKYHSEIQLTLNFRWDLALLWTNFKIRSETLSFSLFKIQLLRNTIKNNRWHSISGEIRHYCELTLKGMKLSFFSLQYTEEKSHQEIQLTLNFRWDLALLWTNFKIRSETLSFSLFKIQLLRNTIKNNRWHSISGEIRHYCELTLKGMKLSFFSLQYTEEKSHQEIQLTLNIRWHRATLRIE